MQEYQTCGVKQTYVYVEEDNFMKGDPFYYDSGSSVQMMKPNQCTPTPYNHHAQPHHGGFDKDFDDSWKMDKPSHGGGGSSKKEQHQYESWKMDKPSHGGGWSSDKEQQHQHANWKRNKPSHGGSKYENSNDMYHSKMGGGGGGNDGYHHGPPHTPPVVWNEPVNYYSDDCNPRYYHPEQKSRYWMSKEIVKKPGHEQYWISKGIED